MGWVATKLEMCDEVIVGRLLVRGEALNGSMDISEALSGSMDISGAPSGSMDISRGRYRPRATGATAPGVAQNPSCTYHIFSMAQNSFP